MYQQQAYWEAYNRANYYLWCALRGHNLPGNDPISGRSRAGWRAYGAEGRVAYKALARYWLAELRRMRVR